MFYRNIFNRFFYSVPNLLVPQINHIMYKLHLMIKICILVFKLLLRNTGILIIKTRLSS